MKQNIIFGLGILIILALASCQGTTDIPNLPDTKTPTTTKTPAIEVESTQDLKKFESKEQIVQFLQNTAIQQSGINVVSRAFDVGAASFDMAVSESAVGAPSASKAVSSRGTDDFSSTNVQVQGVDEADIVKNDGKYIYTISQNKVIIVDAFPADDAEVVSEIKIDGNPRNIFINKDRLVVLADGSGETFVIQQYDFVPRPRYTQVTHVFIYDISDKEDPELVKDYNINGYYLQSRMIDDFVYLIAQENVYYYSNVIDMPVIREGSDVIVRPEVFYFDNPETNYNFNTVASLDIFDEEIEAKTFMMGYASTIFVSSDNIYIAYQKNLPYYWYSTHSQERFYDVVVPLLPSEIRLEINRIKNGNSLNEHEKWDKVSVVLEEMYNSMSESEKNRLIGDIAEEIEEYEAKLAAERAKTVIHKINIDRGNIDYSTRGEVAGNLLNQFSMDEHENNLRVATTVDIWTRKRITHNNVYVLNGNLKEIGSIEGIAPDESIFSTRFIGDRLYMVTFQRIDPLFVIDLSNPRNPKILGELKIPGFSDYLHPYDENHIIGIGKETQGNQWGGVSVKGVKISLFDVSDVSKPKQIDQYEIGTSGTDSEALRDHKAFLFDKEKNILVIPVREVKGDRTYDSRFGYWRQRVWQGAYVFGLTPEDGIEVKGTVTHSEGDENDIYYYTGPNTVRRSLYMDDVLYTVSAAKIKANNLEEIDEEIAEIDLGYEVIKPYPVPYPEEPFILN